jgi:hypothetical protein
MAVGVYFIVRVATGIGGGAGVLLPRQPVATATLASTIKQVARDGPASTDRIR